MGVFVMLSSYTVYFDRSEGQAGTSPRSDSIDGTYVGGFVSSVSAWGKFELGWRLALAQYDVAYFHMKDFIAKKRQFSAQKWQSNKYCATFMATLVAVINDHTMHSFVRGIWHPHFEYINTKFHLSGRFNPYSICGLKCALEARDFIRTKVSTSLPIEYIFDQGDDGADSLTREMLEASLPNPIFRPSRELKDKPDWIPAIQLQACDLVSWEVRREVNRQRTFVIKYPPVRKSFLALSDIPATWKNFDLDSLEAFCIDRGIAPRESGEE
jgi:hypothetical protein